MILLRNYEGGQSQSQLWSWLHSVEKQHSAPWQLLSGNGLTSSPYSSSAFSMNLCWKHLWSLNVCVDSVWLLQQLKDIHGCTVGHSKMKVCIKLVMNLQSVLLGNSSRPLAALNRMSGSRQSMKGNTVTWSHFDQTIRHKQHSGISDRILFFQEVWHQYSCLQNDRRCIVWSKESKWETSSFFLNYC